MSVPDRSGIVRQVDAAYPHLLQSNSHAADGEFLQRVCAAMPPDERWGLLSKSDGENGFTFPNGVRTSHDVIALPDGNRVDVINGAGNHPVPGGPGWGVIPPDQWRPSNVYVDIRTWPIFDSGTPGAGTSHVAKLGCGWFCMLKAFRPDGWPSEARQNFNYLEAELNPDYYRVFLDLEGRDHIKAGFTQDPWELAGCDVRDPAWEDDMARLADLLGPRGKQIHFCMYGGRNHARTQDERRRAHDRVARVHQRFPTLFDGGEGANEFNINNFSEAEVQFIVADLVSKLPGVRMAMSSPALAHGLVEVGGAWREPTNEEMGESIEALYGPSPHFGATEMTIHLSRQSEKWSEPFSYNPYFPELKKRHNEPRGPGASAGGDVSDPAAIASDYLKTCRAGWSHYTFHSRWCAWNGRIPSEYKSSGRWPENNIWDHDGMPEILQALRAIRQGGTTIPTPGGGVVPGFKSALLPGGRILPEQSNIKSPNGKAHFHYQADGNTVIYLDGQPIWSSQSAGIEPGYWEMGADGHFVMYDKAGTPRRATHTWGHPNAMGQLQDDGHWTLYEDPSGPLAGTPIWDSTSSPLYDEHAHEVPR